MHQTLLVELFTEELPPKALKKLGDAFANSIFDYLKADRFLEPASQLTALASPRRLAVQITHVAAESEGRRLRQKWMPIAVAYGKDGKPSAVLEKRLRNEYNLTINVPAILENDFKQEPDEKGVLTLYQDRMAAGRSLNRGLQEALDEAIRTLPVPKVMSYQLADGATTVQFVRPAHALMALHGADVVPVTALGLTAGRTTRGHRFQGAANIELKHADEYESRLEAEGGVVASFDKRKAEIESQLRETAELHGANLGPSADYEALLDEVTALVERPTVYVGAFETEFLTVPAECLILTMKLNQKYFPLFNRAGKLSNQFLIVSNMQLDNPHNIVEGNQRVVRPRLSDARFFFETDKKTKLEARVPKLANVVYHAKLGSQLQRVERVQKIAAFVAESIGADAERARRAAYLAKADLLTDMVGEFPELQGIMGSHYAKHDGEASDVVEAIRDQYVVRAHDPLKDASISPSNYTSNALVIADRVETLVGIWGIGQRPTGDKDPFGLRRSALMLIACFEMAGAVKKLGGERLTLDITNLLEFTRNTFDKPVAIDPSVSGEVITFIYDRYFNQLLPTYGALQTSAVTSQQPPLSEVVSRVKAVREFMSLPEAVSLAAANKRIGNILKKSDVVTNSVSEKLLPEPAERSLFDAMKTTAPEFDKHFAAQNYTAALQSLAPLKIPVDAFFENVMVNAEDLNLRNNRLALLNDLHVMMNKVADLSKLAA
jgi:glycyl-tRNA synthetase beta chain